MDGSTETEQFLNIITPEGVNVEHFIKACGQDDPELLAQFVVSVEKILRLYDKPGRKNSFLALDKLSLSRMLTKLSELQRKLTFTIYEIKVRKIISHLESLNSGNLRVESKIDQQQIKKAALTIKVEQVLINPEVLNCKFSCPKNLYMFVINEILPQAGRQILSINDHQKRYEAVCKGLRICDALIHPSQVEIQISKNTLLQSRSFKMKYEFQFQSTQTAFLRQAGNIINEAILCPSDYKVQWLLLKVLKRMYRLWGQLIHGPLFLNLKNISLFFSDDGNCSKMIKEAAIFCYTVINSKSDLKFVDMLSSSEDLKDLKRNQFYSSKGLALPFELGTIYDSSNLELPIWKYKLHLDKREFHVYQIIIDKPSTLLFWKFQVLGYDVGFGIYKVAYLRKFELEEYDKNQECKSIHKMSKYGHGTPNSKMPTKGHIFVKSGVYHIVFDNSYSMVRGKDIFFQLCHLQANV